MKNIYLLLSSLTFIFGIVLTSFGVFKSIEPLVLIVLISILLFLLLLLLKKEFLFVLTIVIVIFLIGVLRYNTYNTISEDNIRNFISYPKEKVVVLGEIVSDPTKPTKKKFTETAILKVESIKSEGKWKKASGLTLLNVYNKTNNVYQYGDIVLLEAHLSKPFSYSKTSGFDYVRYIADKRIYSITRVNKGFSHRKIGENKSLVTRFFRNIYKIRSAMDREIDNFLKPPYSSILSAMLIGKRTNIPYGLKKMFIDTGTLHVLAISGLHVGIVYLIFRIILRILRIQNSVSVLISVIILICFTIIAGARPSTVRAATMFSILSLGVILKRKISVFNLIGLASLLTLIINPNQIFDAGFLLSYTAVLSIVIIAPEFYRMFKVFESPKSLIGKIRYYLLKPTALSLAVSIGLIPLIAGYFGVISLIVVIANLVVVPLLSLAMGSGILLISFGSIFKNIGPIFAEASQFFIFIMIKSVMLFQNIPYGHFEVPRPNIMIISVYYAVLILVLKKWKRNT